MVPARHSRGFTLIEMSVVLVIIGFIVAAIITGRDLIKSSGIRATISQIDRYNSAVAAFTDKYGYIPGDILSTKAQSYGLYYCSGASSNTISCGNGNGLLQGSTAISPTNFATGGTLMGENLMFFLHLSQTGLIDGSYGASGADVTISGATPTGGSSSSIPAVTVATTIKTTGEILPAAKLGAGNFISVGSAGNLNYYILAGISAINTSGAVTATNNLSPVDAYMIDSKTDDGLPATGTVYAIDPTSTVLSAANGTGLTTASPAATHCVNSGIYNTGNSTYASALVCSLTFQMSVH